MVDDIGPCATTDSYAATAVFSGGGVRIWARALLNRSISFWASRRSSNGSQRRDRHGLIVTTLIGVAGALLGGFVATRVFDVSGTKGFFDLSTWVTAIAGAAVLLLAYHLISGQNIGRRVGGRARRR